MSESPGRLLVVDDNEMNRHMLSRRLTRRGYEVFTAADGQQALDMISERDFDLVLLDIMMPNLSGWDVLERIRRAHTRLEMPVIMATAKDQSEDIVQALQNGANDYVTKPLDLEVVLARVGTHVILKRTHEKLCTANQKLRDDLAAAARVQQAYLPPKAPQLSGCEIAWHYRPCDELGGDFLSFFDLGSDYVGMYMLDVSGHGVPAALMAVAVSRALAPSSSDTCIVNRPDRSGERAGLLITPPGRVADKLNSRFPMDRNACQYFTIVYGLLENRSHIFRFTSAGHPPIVHASPLGEPRFFPTSGGPPIGFFQPEDENFEPYEENTIRLRPGDRLYLYSDGVVEGMDEQGEPFGASRLVRQIATVTSLPLQESVDNLANAVVHWCGDAKTIHDDISILAVELVN